MRSVAVHGHRTRFHLAHTDGSPIVYNGWTLEITVDDTVLDKFGPASPLDIESLVVTGLGAHRPATNYGERGPHPIDRDGIASPTVGYDP